MEKTFLEEIKKEAGRATEELLERAHLEKGDILVVGCSSSEVTGERIGTSSSLETAQAVFEGIYEVVQKSGLYLQRRRILWNYKYPFDCALRGPFDNLFLT